MATLNGQSTQAEVPGVKGENTADGDGVVGTGRRGVVGESETFQGVFGKSGDNAGIVGESQKFHAVFAISHSSNNGGVIGINDAGGFGVIGRGRIGVTGESETFQGVLGTSRDNAGIVGASEKFHAVFGISHGVNNAGVFGTNDKGGFGVIGVSEQGIGISGRGGRLAGLFEGNVEVKGSLNVQGVDLGALVQRIAQIEQQGANVGQLVQRVSSLEQKVAALESQLNTAVSNLTGRVTQTEFAISDLRAKVQQIIQQLGGSHSCARQWREQAICT
jgi:hypothetical protein